MDYKKAYLKLTCDEPLKQTAKDLLADALGEIGFEAFEDTAQGLNAYIPINNFDEEMFVKVLKDFQLKDVTITSTFDDIKDLNWNEAWENAGFEPIDINNKIIIYDARSAYKPLSDSKIYIGIEAKQAFGTGTHQTTRMMVASLLRLSLEGKRILDCGCGTGILSIVASKLGAKEVVSYDIDEWSVTNAEHNAQINDAQNINVLHGNAKVLSHISGLFDIVLANINRNILLNDMDSFVEIMNTDSKLLLSGFYENDAQQLIDKANELGLTKDNLLTDNNWCCLSFTKK